MKRMWQNKGESVQSGMWRAVCAPGGGGGGAGQCAAILSSRVPAPAVTTHCPVNRPPLLPPVIATVDGRLAGLFRSTQKVENVLPILPLLGWGWSGRWRGGEVPPPPGVPSLVNIISPVIHLCVGLLLNYPAVRLCWISCWAS